MTATEPTTKSDRTIEEELRDLGFGRVVAQQVRGRFLTKNGTPNTRKYGLGPQRWERFYHRSLEVSWPTFLGWLLGFELIANGIFASAYAAIGGAAIGGGDQLRLADQFT